MATPKHVVSPNAPRIDPSQAMFSMAKIDHDVPVEFKDNETILLTWASEFEHRLRPSTLRAYAYEIRRFMETWGEVLVTSISGSQFRAYLRRFERLCKHLTRRNPPFGESREQHPRWCLKDLPLAQCGTACPGYDPVSRDVIIHHLDALNCLFQYLGELEVVRNNWPREIRKSLANGRHRDKWSRAKHNLTRMEVQRLLNLAPHRQRRTIYAILAKTGIRYSELVHLTIDPSHYNPGEGWIRVPEFGGKRLGNRLLVVDAILATILTHYMEWREHILLRAGTSHDWLLVNQRGARLPPDAADFNKRALRPDAKKLGITRGDPGGPQLSSHAFRRFFSHQLKKNGIDPYWWNVLRGDLPQDNEAAYISPTLEDIKEQYQRYFPWLDLEPF